MTFNKLPEKLQKKIMALTEDENFQKIFGEDKELDELEEQFTLSRQAFLEASNKIDQRQCLLVIDYLIDTKRINSILFISPALKDAIRDSLIRKMREDFGGFVLDDNEK